MLTDTLKQYQKEEAGSTIDTWTLLSGNTNDLTTMISAEKAELALNLTIAIRNKAITAYNEIMNMQIHAGLRAYNSVRRIYGLGFD